MINVLIPSMPSADDLLPYLERIDAAKWYSNGGPLVQQLTRDVGNLLQAPCTVVSTGTAALELALRAMHLPAGAEVLVPSVTFRATGMAIVNAGLKPVLMDVDGKSWCLSPTRALAYCKRYSGVRAVVPVAAFGLPVNPHAWNAVAEVAGVAVVIDAAGALLGQLVPTGARTAVAYSLHATKAIGAGEGGIVASADPDVVTAAAQFANFGYGGSGGSGDGTNAKMSEYHAAVALASLDAVRKKTAGMRLLEAQYARHLPPECVRQAGDQQCRTLLPVLMPSALAADVTETKFRRAGIETRRWYAPFLHELTQFAACRRADDLTVSTQLAARLLGLPFHAYLAEADVQLVCVVLAESLAYADKESTATA